MNSTIKKLCSAWRIALIAATLTVGACDVANEIADEIADIGNSADVHYYVSLGTSLSVGVQPNSSGTLLPSNAGCIDTAVDFDCVDAVSVQIASDLAVVLAALRDAAGPNTTIIGVNYYNPYLASWLQDAAGQALAVESAQAVAVVTGFLETTYATAGIPLADVAAAFESDDFTTMVASSQPPFLPGHAVGNIVFEYVSNVGHGLAADLTSGYQFDVVDPEVRIKSFRCCLSSNALNPGGSRIVSGQAEQPLMQVIHFLVGEVSVHQEAQIGRACVHIVG